jgi:hypothetical protein
MRHHSALPGGTGRRGGDAVGQAGAARGLSSSGAHVLALEEVYLTCVPVQCIPYRVCYCCIIVEPELSCVKCVGAGLYV